MKQFLICITFLISGFAFAGPSVTGGFGDNHIRVRCADAEDNLVEIRATPMPEEDEAFVYLASGVDHFLKCEKKSNQWKCLDPQNADKGLQVLFLLDGEMKVTLQVLRSDQEALKITLNHLDCQKVD